MIDENADVGRQERQLEHRVLELLIEEPALWTVEELVRLIGRGDDSFAVRDAVSNALSELAGYGLIHRLNQFVFPGRAADRLHRLINEHS